MERVNEKYFEMKENNNSRYQNFWNAAKAMLRGKFIVINTYIKELERLKINNIILRNQKKQKTKLEVKIKEK